MTAAVSSVAMAPPSRNARWVMTAREEQIAAKWSQPRTVYSDVVMYQTLRQLLYLAYVPLGLFAVVCVGAGAFDLMREASGRDPYFRIDSDILFYFVWLPASGLMMLERNFTTQIAKLKYIGQLQECSFQPAGASHD